MIGTRAVIERSMVTLALVGALAGCNVARLAQPTDDPVESWSATPLAPDAGLAAKAVAEHSACSPNPGVAVEVLLQDRRMPNMAAFLVQGATTFGSCLVGLSGSFGSAGPRPDPMTGPLSIDDNGNGTSNGMDVRTLGGRVAIDAASIRVELPAGRVIEASAGGGYWLAWWPGSDVATRVVAVDANGAIIATLAVPQLGDVK